MKLLYNFLIFVRKTFCSFLLLSGFPIHFFKFCIFFISTLGFRSFSCVPYASDWLDFIKYFLDIVLSLSVL